MSATERVHRHRERLSERRAEAERIARTYFRNDPPLTAKERRGILREMPWLIEAE